MSPGQRRAPEKAEPLTMTDAEVAAMARGEKDIARRIARHSPTQPIGKLVSDKPAPPRISVDEMNAIQRGRGRLPDSLRERLQKAGEAELGPEPKASRKPVPAEEPTGGG